MDVFLAVLIIVPTAAALLVGSLYILVMVAMSAVAAVDATVAGIRHRFGEHGAMRHTHYGTPALHH
jgi:hypothetical protein